ncbi:MAG: hypothetical protein ACK52I_00745 [Pseudomonadota bacterium]|jgi:hypothetical protein
METVIKIGLLLVAIPTGLLWITECWNMAIVIHRRKGKAEISISNAVLFALSLYLMGKI